MALQSKILYSFRVVRRHIRRSFDFGVGRRTCLEKMRNSWSQKQTNDCRKPTKTLSSCMEDPDGPNSRLKPAQVVQRKGMVTPKLFVSGPISCCSSCQLTSCSYRNASRCYLRNSRSPSKSKRRRLWAFSQRCTRRHRRDGGGFENSFSRASRRSK